VEFVHLYWAGLPASPLWEASYALVAVLAFVGLNAISTEASGGAETIVTLVKVAILAIFVGFGIGAIQAGAFQPLFPADGGAATVLPAMGLTFIAFQGYDLIATVTEEVENPRRNIPRAIFLSLAATLLIYLLVVAVAIGALGPEAVGAAGETAIVEAAASFMPDIGIFGAKLGAILIAFGAVFSTISALNAVIIGASRVAFAMGRDGQLPQRLGTIHQRYGTPFMAILTSAAVMLVATALAPISVVGNLASLFSLLGFIVVNFAVIRLRRERPDLSRPFAVPFYPVTPIVGILLNALLALFIAPQTWLIAAAWLAFGVLVYAGLHRMEVGPTPGGSAR
ncbi:MAG: APC family permease, partial [Salinirussus sp.]